MWELLQQRLMRLRSSWRDELYSRVTIGNWGFVGFPFVKVIMYVMCALAYIMGVRVVTICHSGCLMWEFCGTRCTWRLGVRRVLG